MREKQEVVREAVLSAGSIIKDAFLQPPGGDETIEKGKNDFVTEVDLRSEKMIIDILKESFPDIGILAEEDGEKPDSDTFWIIDPLDGTTNFMHRYPVIGISVALYSNREVVLGTIYDPLRGELFEALRGQGAYLNGERISVSSARALPASLLGTGFPFRVRSHLDEYIRLFKLLFNQCRGIRRAGAAVIDLAYVASGRLDGFFELYLKPWDMAAGGLMVTEAGGVVSDFLGTSHFLSTGHIIASNSAVYEGLLAAARSVFDEEALAGFGTGFEELG